MCTVPFHLELALLAFFLIRCARVSTWSVLCAQHVLVFWPLVLILMTRPKEHEYSKHVLPAINLK